MWQPPPKKEKKVSVNLGPYGKAIVAALGAGALYLTDNVFSVADGVDIALAVLTALGVYALPNVPSPAPPAYDHGNHGNHDYSS